MDPFRSYPILASLLSPFRKSQRKTLGLVIAAVVSAGEARSMRIATQMQVWLGILLQSALNRLYRMLHNPRIDEGALTERLLDVLARRPQRHLLVSFDWTEWAHGLRMLVGSVVAGRRAIPVICAAYPQRVARRSQNTRENLAAQMLARAAHASGVGVTVLCDRGFRRRSWLRHLHHLGLHFVVRLMDDVLWELEPGLRVPLRHSLLHVGRAADLGWVTLGRRHHSRVRVIGYWAPGTAEPWWLATNREDPPSRIVALYDRRMTVEEQFRDTKGTRFGVKLQWTQFRNPDTLGRFALLLGVAILIWTLVGRLAAERDPHLRLVCHRKGPRLSYVTIGLGMVAFRALLPPITCALLRRLLEPPDLRRVAGTRRGGK